jgi:hypothetical protein
MPRLAPTTNRSLTGGLRVSMAIWPSHLPYRGQGSSSLLRSLQKAQGANLLRSCPWHRTEYRSFPTQGRGSETGSCSLEGFGGCA